MLIQVKQLGFKFRTWGGKRRGAGPKIKGPRRWVSHRTRPELKRRFPVHVTVRMREDICGLRSIVCFRALKQTFLAANARAGFRVVHYSVQSNHLHFIVEAEGNQELSRGMQGLNVRMAKAINRLMKRGGKVLADRYHAVILRTPTQTKNAVHYVLNNRRHHAPGRYWATWRDPFASVQGPVAAAGTWLLARCSSPPSGGN